MASRMCATRSLPRPPRSPRASPADAASPAQFSLTSLAIPGQYPSFRSLVTPHAHFPLSLTPVTQILSSKPCIFAPRSANSFATPPIARISIPHHLYSTFRRPTLPAIRTSPSLQTIRKPQLPPTSAAPGRHKQLQTQNQTRPPPQTSMERTPIPLHQSPRTPRPSSPHFGIYSCTLPTILSTRVPSPPPHSSQNYAEKTNSSATPSTRTPTNSSIIC